MDVLTDNESPVPAGLFVVEGSGGDLPAEMLFPDGKQVQLK